MDLALDLERFRGALPPAPDAPAGVDLARRACQVGWISKGQLDHAVTRADEGRTVVERDSFSPILQ